MRLERKSEYDEIKKPVGALDAGAMYDPVGKSDLNILINSALLAVFQT